MEGFLQARVCYGGIPQGTQLSHLFQETQSQGIATKHHQLVL